MTISPDQTAEILAVVAELDDRLGQITIPQARAWTLALTHAGITYDEAMAAVPMYYADPDSRYLIKPPDIVRIATAIRIEDAEQRRRIQARARHALPPAGTPGGPPPQPPLRDRREDLHRLLESVRTTSDGHERWPLTGDADMRRQQTTSRSPEARAAADKASRLKALQIVADSRARSASGDTPPNTPEG